MKIEIKNRFNDSVIFTTDAESLGAAIVAAIAVKANLCGANLRGANLRDANLRGANLRGANLCAADLCGAKIFKLEDFISQRTILADGEIVGWKKLHDGTICKLKIPSEARRVGGLVGRKCRAEYAVVLEGAGKSSFDLSFTYSVGRRVDPDSFDPNPLVECSHGIHFFITRREAELYN